MWVLDINNINQLIYFFVEAIHRYYESRWRVFNDSKVERKDKVEEN